MVIIFHCICIVHAVHVQQYRNAVVRCDKWTPILALLYNGSYTVMCLGMCILYTIPRVFFLANNIAMESYLCMQLLHTSIIKELRFTYPCYTYAQQHNIIVRSHFILAHTLLCLDIVTRGVYVSIDDLFT